MEFIQMPKKPLERVTAAIILPGQHYKYIYNFGINLLFEIGVFDFQMMYNHLLTWLFLIYSIVCV